MSEPSEMLNWMKWYHAAVLAHVTLLMVMLHSQSGRSSALPSAHDVC